MEVEVDDSLPTNLADGVAVQVVPVLVPLQAAQARVHLATVAAREPALAALLVYLGHVQPQEPLGRELSAAYFAVRRPTLFRPSPSAASFCSWIVYAFLLSFVYYHSVLPASLSSFFRSPFRRSRSA